MSLPVTEDTPPDMLAGCMDLKVILPDGHSVKMSIQRGTPMMDLLVQITTANCLSPGDFSLQAMGDKGVLPFKPSTPIGVLDAFTVKIVEKKHKRAPQVPQSFLNTFRLQVHLPRSQLFVIRVTSDVTLSEIMTHICTEKNLNLEKYEFRNPGNLDEVLELDKTLGYYKLQELTMMSKGNRTVTGLMSSADMINVKSSKHRQNSVCDSSLSSGSYGSRSGSPVPGINVVTAPPQPPIRKKRRPAPKPPGFAENEKKDQTNGSVLISHSRESSDSSGYHEASVLSESPTHGGPAGGMESDSPPDTLPRRSKLPPSQSFTNLTSIPAAPRGRLTNSISNISLNSNGLSRKKRAPPPPPAKNFLREDKIKSSTLPTSVSEERRNGATYINENNFRHYKAEPPVDALDASNDKVQIPVEITSAVVNETKASRDEVPASLDVDVRLPPKPKPRTVLSGTEITKVRIQPKSHSQTSLTSLDIPEEGKLNRWNNFENLTKEEILSEDSGQLKEEKRKSCGVSDCKFDGAKGLSVGGDNSKKTVNSLLVGSPEVREDSPAQTENQDLSDQDSINWEYQLPPPPTDFRDTHSPSCTEFGTITITPEILENLDDYKREPEERFFKSERRDSQTNFKSQINEEKRVSRSDAQNHHFRPGTDKKLSQSKCEVMNELTNILNGNRKHKERSLSVSNLYINDSNPKDFKKNALNYSRSFSTEPVSALENFKLSTYIPNSLENNKKLSSSNEAMYNSKITYKNYKNLEKSSSMESIQTQGLDNHLKFIEKSEDSFRKPVAPVQKKLKVAKRSASSIGVNTSSSHQRTSTESSQNSESWTDDPSLNVLRQQFLEFLKEKKLMNTELKSLEVMRNILPELKNMEKDVQSQHHSHVSLVVNQNETISQGNALEEIEKEEKEDKVKVVDVKIKNVVPVEDEVVLRRDSGIENKVEIHRETLPKPLPEKKEVSKRYSYQGPPSINFSTWGERPKTTKIVIKDEDYVTQDKITVKKSETVQVKSPEVSVSQKPKEVKKPAQIVIKKSGGMSHYEMFSALPRRKEISSLELVQMEDEERRKRTERAETKESNRVPVVCGVELKKEFKSPSKSPSFPTAEPETTKPRHSVSVYVNGNQDYVEKEPITSSIPCYNFILPKRNSSLMPVVKGFRGMEDRPIGNTVNISNCSNHININISSKKEEVNDSTGVSSNSRSPTKIQANGSVPPPPPPNISMVKLRPVSSAPKPKPVSQDPRGQLLDEIRNFGGLGKLKKSRAF